MQVAIPFSLQLKATIKRRQACLAINSQTLAPLRATNSGQRPADNKQQTQIINSELITIHICMLCWGDDHLHNGAVNRRNNNINNTAKERVERERASRAREREREHPHLHQMGG